MYFIDNSCDYALYKYKKQCLFWHFEWASVFSAMDSFKLLLVSACLFHLTLASDPDCESDGSDPDCVQWMDPDRPGFPFYIPHEESK